MSKYDILLATIAVGFCLWATYTDMRTGKIKNACSIGLLYAGVISQVMFLLLEKTIISASLSVFIIGGIIAFGSYWLGILAPGDAKLYWGIVMILPPSVWGRNLSAFPNPALIILVNMFRVYLVYSLIHTGIKYFTLHKTFALPRALPVKEFIQQLPENLLSLLRFLAILLCVEFFAYQSRSQFTFFHLMLAILLSYGLDRGTKKFQIKAYISYPVYFIPAVVILVLQPFLLQVYWKKFLLFAAIYHLVLPLMSAYMLNWDMSCLSTFVPIEQLQPGMIPAEKIIASETAEGTTYRTEPAVISESFDKNVLVSPTPAGLSDEAVQELKELAKSGRFEDFGGTLAIQHSVHFAPIILTGTLLTIVCGGVFYAPMI
ncbi:MAG: hypothetical protein OXG97_01670 [Candidatus Poribacteria bacterium]|nr:hypothetical protein [Candidatus Poribacteria bacterium]